MNKYVGLVIALLMVSPLALGLVFYTKEIFKVQHVSKD
jgi:hypothetical protein